MVRASLCRLSLARSLNVGDPVRADSGNASSAATPSLPTALGPRSSQTSSTRLAATKDDATRAPPSTRSLVMPFSASAPSTAGRSSPGGVVALATRITCAPAAPSFIAAGASDTFEVITHNGVSRAECTSRLVHSARETPLWVMTSNVSEAPAAMKLGAAGAQVIRVASATTPPGLDLPAVLGALAEKGITRLLVEGGARVASSFVAANLVDEVWLLRGPKAVGSDGVAALDALPLSALTGSPTFKLRANESLQRDALTIYQRA